MPITETQLTRRAKNLGSSDLPAICGVSPWTTAYDVWLDKTGRLEPLDDASAPLVVGTYMESAILDWASRDGGLGALRRNQERRVAGTPILCHIDAVLAGGDPVEVKTAGLFGPLAPEWGEPGTDEIPDSVTIQCHAHMLATDADVCHVAALLGGRGLVLYAVPLTATLGAALIARAAEFWALVESDTPPPQTLPTLEAIKRVRREPSSVVSLDWSAVQTYESLQANAKAAAQAADDAKRVVLAALGTAEAGDLPNGRRVTYYEQTRKAYAVKETTSRVMRITKPKESKT